MMIERAHPSSLSAAEVLERVLDRGIVIDALNHVFVAGIELVTVRSHMVVASIATYLEYFGEGAGLERPGPAQRETPLREPLGSAPVVDFPAFLPDDGPLRP
jgi:hypothetical protein